MDGKLVEQKYGLLHNVLSLALLMMEEQKKKYEDG